MDLLDERELRLSGTEGNPQHIPFESILQLELRSSGTEGNPQQGSAGPDIVV